MHILLTNDDGIDSPLLHTLCRAAAARGHEVTVAAPATQQSGKGHAFTVFEPVQVEGRSLNGAQRAFAVHGTPADSCRIGFMELCGGRPDLVISGINKGWNAGLATYVSGTVGAAREAAFHDIPALAVSAAVKTPEETIRFFSEWAVHLGERFVRHSRPDKCVCNLNVPAATVGRLRPPVMCPVSTDCYRDHYERFESPRGATYYCATLEEDEDSPEEGTDLHYLLKGHITCTLLTPRPCAQETWRDLLDNM